MKKQKPTQKKKNARPGQPTAYRPGYCQELIDFFNVEPTSEKEITTIDKKGNVTTRITEVPNRLPTFEFFAASHGVCRDTVNAWSHKFPQFSDAVRRAKDFQKNFLMQNGLAGHYPPSSYIFTAKNITDMKDDVRVESEGLGKLVEMISGYGKK